MYELRQLSIRELVVCSLSKGDRGLGIDQTKQTEAPVWTRRNRPTIGNGPERTDAIQVWARQNSPNFGMGQTELRDRKFVQTMSSVAPDPSVHDPGPSGPYLSRVADFILGYKSHRLSKSLQMLEPLTSCL